AAVAADGGLATVAARLRARAHQLVACCDGATTELLRSPVSDGLTSREREVAGFAARGLTDGEIATRLSVSKRTIETHLYRVYAKLGVSGRPEPAALFTGPPRGPRRRTPNRPTRPRFVGKTGGHGDADAGDRRPGGGPDPGGAQGAGQGGPGPGPPGGPRRGAGGRGPRPRR